MKRSVFLVALLCLLALGALPLANSAYALRIGTFACMYAIMSVSWTVIGGFAGYPSFATAAFFGFGAYCGGVLLAKGWPLLATVGAAGGLAFAGALLLGIVLLRLRGHYFAIASLAVAEVLRELTNTATDLTGGGMGLNIPLAVTGSGGVMAEASFFFWAMWLLLVVSFVAVARIQVSRLGFGLSCIKQNEAAADMIGVNATLYKSTAFALSGVFVAMAGVLYAAWVHYIEPPDVFDVLFAVKPIVMALLGGLGSPAGAVLGAFAFLAIEETVWRNYLEIHTGVLGLMVVLLLLFLPNGLMSLARRLRPAGARHG
ncbi:MAG: inner-rane translocator [Paucimonas sp.]|nr:inner-rane translocator [Paucimonas sp.]